MNLNDNQIRSNSIYAITKKVVIIATFSCFTLKLVNLGWRHEFNSTLKESQLETTDLMLELKEAISSIREMQMELSSMREVQSTVQEDISSLKQNQDDLAESMEKLSEE